MNDMNSGLSLPLPDAAEFSVARLGTCTYPTPGRVGGRGHFVNDDDAVLATSSRQEVQRLLANHQPLPAFELAGPREFLHFSPSGVAAGIVTCGGLCPGMNNVIRALVLTLHHVYGVRTTYGFRYGFAGLGTDIHEPLRHPRVRR